MQGHFKVNFKEGSIRQVLGIPARVGDTYILYQNAWDQAPPLLPVLHPGRQQMKAQVLGCLAPTRETQMEFQALASAWPS